MDSLSTILDAIHLKSMVYEKLTLSAPWGLDLLQDNNSQFWRLEKGRCFLKISGAPAIEMKEGDLIFVPHGSSHWIADNPRSKRIPSAKYVAAKQEGHPLFNDGENKTILVGGHFEFDTRSLHPFLKDLPAIMHISALKQTEHSWLQQSSRLLFEELGINSHGSRIIISRLAEIIFIYIIRTYLEQADNMGGFLLALKDERISNGLRLMQESPEKEWTLDMLATNVGMSRTLFFNDFKRLVGETPISYLTNWRIIKSKEILMVSKENISEIAIQVGYQSEAAFNRIFKLKTGQTPANYRRTTSPLFNG
jgi:AraC-like DNA-binding protein